MRAALRSTASGVARQSGQFAALHHITRQMDIKEEVSSGVRGPALQEPPAEMSVMTGVAEGAGLAHDAGNLLGALRLYSDLLAMPGVLHEEHRDYAAELRLLSGRSWAMIERLMDHAHAGHRARGSTAEFSVLPDIVDRCKGLLSRVADRTVEIHYGIGAFEPVGVSSEAVERVLTNLVKNAAEATPWVGAISIVVVGATEETEDGSIRRRVVLTVRDLGCGMDAAAVRRLMHGDGVSTASRRGLGFRVVRELVALSGGCLSIESQPGRGTSISAEWYVVDHTETGELREDLSHATKSESEIVWKEDGEWIAC